MGEKISRRDFLKLSGLGAAATAVLTGCGPASRYVTRHPYANMPEFGQTGISTFYATTCRECPAACGLIVRTREGRALKIEGNPEHPVNHGKLCPRGLTSVQGLYNPDRIQYPIKKTRRSRPAGSKIKWDEAISVISDALNNTPADQIAFMLGLYPDHIFHLTYDLTRAIGAPAPVRFSGPSFFEARFTLLSAAGLVLGAPVIPHFDIANSDYVLSFGADFLETWLSPVAYTRAYSQMRRGKNGQRGRLVVLEAHQSMSGGSADEWYPAIPGAEVYAALAIGALAAEKLGSTPPPMFANINLEEAANLCGIPLEKLEHIASQFASAAHPLAIPGGAALGQPQGQTAAQAILALNALVNNLDKPGGLYADTSDPGAASFGQIQDLIQRMQNGKVKVLFVHGTNPVYSLPVNSGFKAALEKVPMVISFASFMDETALESDYVLPDHTALESFGYQVTPIGADRPTISASQPVVAPLYDTRATADVLLAAAKSAGGKTADALDYSDEVDYIQKKLLELLSVQGGNFADKDLPSFWSHFLQIGGFWLEKETRFPLQTQPNLTATLKLEPSAPLEANQLYFVPYATQLGEAGANRPWLQETPHPTTTVMWNSWVEINPQTAKKLGIKDDDVVEISSAAGKIHAVAYLYPAIRPDTIAMPFGQGHAVLGRFAEKRGVNPMVIVDSLTNESGDLAFAATRVTVIPTGETKPIARLESREGVYGSESH
jgi:anaerobic selenocysteine-containing dehydrogenase